MAEQRMKVRDKKVQKMTKDGLVEENLTDKSSVRVSNRASDVQMGIKQGEKEESLVDKSPRQSERSGKNIRPSVQKSRDAPELMRTENQSEDFGQNRKQQNRKRIRAEVGKESRLADERNAERLHHPLPADVTVPFQPPAGSIQFLRIQPGGASE